MLRITVDDNADPIVLRAEGKLRGPWVAELEKCWRSTAASAAGKRIRLDLRGVMSVDQNANTLLSEMVEDGVELCADGPMMTSLVEQIVSPARQRKDRSI
jgi:hypothetical protein